MAGSATTAHHGQATALHVPPAHRGQFAMSHSGWHLEPYQRGSPRKSVCGSVCHTIGNGARPASSYASAGIHGDRHLSSRMRRERYAFQVAVSDRQCSTGSWLCSYVLACGGAAQRRDRPWQGVVWAARIACPSRPAMTTMFTCRRFPWRPAFRPQRLHRPIWYRA